MIQFARKFQRLKAEDLKLLRENLDNLPSELLI